MEWSDDGIVLSAKKHGETAAIITLLTRYHGRHLGLVRGGAGRRARGQYQPGNRLHVEWHGRLAEHLGTYKCEMIEAVSAKLLKSPSRLIALSSACATADAALPEREIYPQVFDGLAVLLNTLVHDKADDAYNVWASVYAIWELGLLKELGFGLDLSKCAATGTTEYLTHVSPKSGRAVSADAAKPYLEKLLVLPDFFLQPGKPGMHRDVLDGLRLTGYFLNQHVFSQGNSAKQPDARRRFIQRLKSSTS
tara:strand:- start:3906 stop:4655 length:750 start_codon:yes stop_codon:yes gene_type:complete